MESTGQQTDDSSESEIVPWRTRILRRIWPLIFVVVFLGLAISLAIVYAGTRPSPQPRQSIPRQDLRSSPKRDLLDTSIHKYPFIGALISEKPYLFLCTVVILTKRYFLTEAHCYITNFPHLWIRVNSNLWDSKGNKYKVQDFIIHEEYNETNMENNVALIMVQKSIIMGENIKPANLDTNVLRKGIGYVVGWTNHWPMADQVQITLMEQKLLIWEAGKCKNYIGIETSSKFICASINNSALCYFDVTGPLIVDGKLVGLWSGGLSCTNYPSLFVDLSYFKIWIWSKIKD